MLHQTFLVSRQVVFLFVLFLASVNLASAIPVCNACRNNTADSASKKVNYNVQISEAGKQYNESIEVDTEKQTELFKVPAHNNVDHSNILHDFKMNLSMLLLPEEKICYLLPLDKELSAPTKLLSDLDNAEKSISKLKVIDNKWTVGSKLTDRSVLSEELANLCSKYPIYYAENMEDSLLTTTRIQTGGRETRNRRQVISLNVRRMMIEEAVDGYREIPVEKVCTGGKRKPSEDDEADCVWNQNKTWKVRCEIRTRTCYHIDVCNTLDECFKDHIYNNIYCCKYVCV